MLQGALLGLAVVTAITSTGTAVNPKAVATASREVLRGCGNDEVQFMSAPDDDWTPIAGAGDRHATFRGSLKEPIPASQSTVSIYAVGGDLATTEFSVILTRDGGGVWSGTAVGQTKIWIEGAKPSLMPRKAWVLSDVKGRRLDEVLTDRCFYAEPTSFHNKQAPGIGVLFTSVDVETPGHQRHFFYKGGQVGGLSKELTTLTFPPAP